MISPLLLVRLVAAHSGLGPAHLCAHPPVGLVAADAAVGAQLMSYGGDAVHVAPIVVLVSGWCTATRPREVVRLGARPVP